MMKKKKKSTSIANPIHNPFGGRRMIYGTDDSQNESNEITPSDFSQLGKGKKASAARTANVIATETTFKDSSSKDVDFVSEQTNEDVQSRRIRLPRSTFTHSHTSREIPIRPVGLVGDGDGSTLDFNDSSTSLNVLRYNRGDESAFRVVKSERKHCCQNVVYDSPKDLSQDKLDKHDRHSKKTTKKTETEQYRMKEVRKGVNLSHNACDDPQGKNTKETVRNEALEAQPCRGTLKQFLSMCQDLTDLKNNERTNKCQEGAGTQSKPQGNEDSIGGNANLEGADKASPAVQPKKQSGGMRSSFTNRKYFVRREKHSNDGNDLKPTYTIHIESPEDLSDSQSLDGASVTKRQVVKMKRGDIRMLKDLNIQSQENLESRAHTACLHAKSDHHLCTLETPDCHKQHSVTISPSKNSCRLKKKTISRKKNHKKNKSGLRLIDHLEREEKLQADFSFEIDDGDQTNQPTLNTTKDKSQNEETGEQDTNYQVMLKRPQSQGCTHSVIETKSEENPAAFEIQQEDRQSDIVHDEHLEVGNDSGSVSRSKDIDIQKQKNRTSGQPRLKLKQTSPPVRRSRNNSTRQSSCADTVIDLGNTNNMDNEKSDEVLALDIKRPKDNTLKSKPPNSRKLYHLEKEVHKTLNICKSLTNADDSNQSPDKSKRQLNCHKTDFQTEGKETKLAKSKPLSCLAPFFNSHSSSVQCRYNFKTSVSFEKQTSISKTCSHSVGMPTQGMNTTNCHEKSGKATVKLTDTTENLRISKTHVSKSHHGRNKTENCSSSIPAAVNSAFIDMVDCKCPSSYSGSGDSFTDLDMMPAVEARQNENHSNQQSSYRQTRHKNGDVSSESGTPTSPRFPLRFKKSTSPHKTDTISLKTLHKLIAEAKADSCVTVKQRDVNRNSDEAISYHSPSNEDHYSSTFIGEYLLKLWKSQCLCDVKVVVGNDTFLAHKLVLAAFSDVFCPTTPQPEPVLAFNVPGSNSAAVYQIFNYIYTSSMQLNDEILGPLLSAALFMGISEVVDIVKEILSKPTLDNFGLYIDILNDHGIHASLASFPDLYRNHFSDLFEHEKFMLLPIQDLEEILSDPEVLVQTEVDTITAIVGWIKYNTMDRISLLPRLLKRVSFEVIPPQILANLTSEYSYLFNHPGTHEVISEAFKFHALKLDGSVRESSQELNSGSIDNEKPQRTCSRSNCSSDFGDGEKGRVIDVTPDKFSTEAMNNISEHSRSLAQGTMKNRQLHDIDDETFEGDHFYHDNMSLQGHPNAAVNCLPITSVQRETSADRSVCFGRSPGSPSRPRHRESSVRHSLLNGQQKKWSLSRQSQWTEEEDDGCKSLIKPTKCNFTIQNQPNDVSSCSNNKTGTAFNQGLQASCPRISSSYRPARVSRRSVNRNLNNNARDSFDEKIDAVCSNCQIVFFEKCIVRICCQ